MLGTYTTSVLVARLENSTPISSHLDFLRGLKPTMLFSSTEEKNQKGEQRRNQKLRQTFTQSTKIKHFQ